MLKTVAAVSLTLGLAGCEATGQPREDVQPAAREDAARQLRTLPAFRALDADDDGDLSAGEIDAAPESLASLDDDGDGRLSHDELRPRQDGPRVFFGSPANLPEGTGVMTLGADEEVNIADLPPQLRSLLSPADGDGDGTASAMELLAAMMALQGGEPGVQEPGSAEGAIAPSPGIQTGGGGPRAQTSLMAALDVDQDGMVSETEMVSAAQSLRTLDTDGDGRISPGELQPASSSGSSGNDLPE